MTRARWLLDVEIDGVAYRWADAAVEVETAAGDVLDYSAGLDEELELAQGDPGIRIEILDPSVNWPVLGREVDGRRATLRRWIEGTVFEQAEVYAFGETASVAFGARSELVSFTIEDVSGSALSLGTQVPDVLARVDETTWPVDSGHLAGTGGGIYPVIFGYPGYTGGGAPVCVVPVPLAQWDNTTFDESTSYVVVSEDPDNQIAACRIRNDALDVEGSQTVVRRTDLLGRDVLVAHFSADAAPFPESETTQLYAGYHPAQGGGPRSAYDVVDYLLRRFGPETVDRARLPEIRDILDNFQVDSWIDEPMQDPWAWIEDVLIPDLLLEVRVSARGRYLISRRFVADGSRRVGSVSVDRGEAQRVEGFGISRPGQPVNEFTALYRGSLEGDWLARVVLSGGTTVISAPIGGAVSPTTTQAVTLATTARCRESLSRYGLRQSEDGALEIDWTWDTGTVLRCLERRAERDAIPAFVTSLEIDDGEDLVEGDEIEVYDSELGWDGVVALVDAPPIRGVISTVQLRIAL